MLIGLTGRAGAGKGSVAGVLVARHYFTEMAFADPLYRMVSVLTGLTVDQLHDRAIKERVIPWIGKSPRQLLQSLGTEWGRQLVADDIWITVTLGAAEHMRRAVVTDVRFDNEAAAIRDAGGVVWRVVREGHSCLVAETARHASEAGVDESLVDDEIANDGTFDDLAESVDAAMGRLQATKIAV